MQKLFKRLGIQDALKKGLIARIIVMLSLVYVIFGFIFLTVRFVMTVHPAFPAAHLLDWLLESMILIVGLIALGFVRKDRMRAASRVVLTGMFIAVTMQTYFLGDPANDIAGAMGLQLFAILSILLLERGDRFIAILLVIGVFIGLNLLSTSGYLMPSINLTPMGKIMFTLFIWLSASIIIGLVLIVTMGAIRREPQLLQQQFGNGTQSDSGDGKNSLPYLSTHDALTGLYNRLFFETEFTRLEKSRLFPISIIFALVNGLESVNEEHGVSAGDRLVLNVAALFTKVFRQEDIISRYNEDEFAILLPSSDAAILEVVIKRTNEQLNAYNKSHKDMPLDISIGTTTTIKGESLKSSFKMAKKLAKQDREKNKSS